MKKILAAVASVVAVVALTGTPVAHASNSLKASNSLSNTL